MVQGEGPSRSRAPGVISLPTGLKSKEGSSPDIRTRQKGATRYTVDGCWASDFQNYSGRRPLGSVKIPKREEDFPDNKREGPSYPLEEARFDDLIIHSQLMTINENWNLERLINQQICLLQKHSLHYNLSVLSPLMNKTLGYLNHFL